MGSYPSHKWFFVHGEEYERIFIFKQPEESYDRVMFNKNLEMIFLGNNRIIYDYYKQLQYIVLFYFYKTITQLKI